jgi:hypothetical protein
METDSWECGGMNWTDNFSEEFKNYRGYDLINYLPIVAGYVIADTTTSNAFLSDFRKTLGDLVAYNHYARFQEYAQNPICCTGGKIRCRCALLLRRFLMYFRLNIPTLPG